MMSRNFFRRNALKPLGTKILILGAGLGGLASSIRLRKAGFTVTVIEQNQYPGGKAHQRLLSSPKGDFRFDAGPSMMTIKSEFEDLFTLCGKKIEHVLPLFELEVISTNYFDDGTVIQAYSDLDKLCSEISSKTKDSPESVKTFLLESKQLFSLSKPFFEKNLSLKEISLPNIWPTIQSLRNHIPWIDMHTTLQSYFTDPKTVQLFDRYATYTGSNPFTASSLLHAIAHVQHNEPAYIPQNGIQAIPDSLYALALELGVQFEFNQKVRSIHPPKSTSESWQIETDQNQFLADIVLSNIDAYTTQTLINSNRKDIKLPSRKELSSSGLIFLWGIDTTTELGLHSLFYAKDYYHEFQQIFEKQTTSEDPTVYVYISSKYIPSDAPVGMENWFVMINTPPHNGNTYTLTEIEKIKQNVVKKIEKHLSLKLLDHIIVEDYWTAHDIDTLTGSYMGSLYGLQTTSVASLLKRPQNTSHTFPRLYYVGGSTHSGGGMPMVLNSATLACNSIMTMYGI